MAGLRADGGDHFSRPVGHVQRPVPPAADLDVAVLLLLGLIIIIIWLLLMALVVHDVVPAGRVAIRVKLDRLRPVGETHIQQMILIKT